jgi:hypothetical protein
LFPRGERPGFLAIVAGAGWAEDICVLRSWAGCLSNALSNAMIEIDGLDISKTCVGWIVFGAGRAGWLPEMEGLNSCKRWKGSMVARAERAE